MKHLEERGVTLVEVLTSLVILGIVFIGFMTVFPQMTSFNMKTSTKLEAMNEARNLLETIQHVYTYDEFSQENGYEVENDEWVKKESNELGVVEYRIAKTPSLQAGATSNESNLHVIQINIAKDDKVVSGTFGFIEIIN
ncbi:prepilin-type N-terminal cleavage/methylation domain-containing protein [Sporosarcina contaminans]|uniref:Prepilin-type N-terminal cleavage/methylation domain-containing protein n=1 Tax=Sporosarcina contaminans TaxID=633403 RepID=A0ABW3TTH4_9BACL